jgi:hypothetical protein
MVRFILLSALLVVPAAHARELTALTDAEVASGLREALAQGAERAVMQLGRENGYLANPKVRIPLPDSLARVEHTLRRLGAGRYTDELITAMNRAAEASAPEAKSLLLDAVRRMTIEDATDILTGGDVAATAYFRRHTEAGLTARFQPIVKQATEQARVAEAYGKFAGRAAKYGLIRAEEADLTGYVTRKALDGLYLTIAEEERAIRQHPLEQTRKLVRIVFGSLIQPRASGKPQ